MPLPGPVQHTSIPADTLQVRRDPPPVLKIPGSRLDLRFPAPGPSSPVGCAARESCLASGVLDGARAHAPRWHRLERDWWAEEGGYSSEPPGDIHTLEVPKGVAEMTTLAPRHGWRRLPSTPDGVPLGVEEVFSKIAAARAHDDAVGLGAGYVDRFLR